MRTEPPGIRVGLSTIERPVDLFSIMSWRMSTAFSPNSFCGWRICATDVEKRRYIWLRSKPTTARSCGTRNPLYFSRSLIPYPRNKTELFKVYKHVGIYAYTRTFLMQYAAMASTPLESISSIIISMSRSTVSYVV